MNRERKLELIQRSLGIRHKLKVHESLETPLSHEDMAVMLLAKWELENELHAVEDLIAGFRNQDVEEKKELIEKGILKPSKVQAKREADSDEDNELADDYRANLSAHHTPKKNRPKKS